ncbi:hypothetical protein EDF56_10611 [Novosphingobium sp. PhB165]|uniref:alpha/beta hydrolase n=1 Tax=Novosphingobium sp. PhB165 TaxID=2485105 RepID=UPI0010E21D04|nr:alpha/beta fold hydrolase [Novosphingobium sp. PhB165]TCM16899.1 hypothetical protein EDF56_10611 [Novosphingobium sp. PhB165]
MRRLLLTAIVAIGGFYLAAVLLLFLTQRSIVYPAHPHPAPTPSGFERVTLHTDDGLALTAAWRPAAPGKRTVLFFHGNGDNLPGAAKATQRLADAGYGVLLADYRGYSGNPGKPTETGLIRDGEAARAFLETKGVTAPSLILMGASLGTGVATRLAHDHAPAALVLVSPFTSLPDVAARMFRWLPVRMLLLDRFESLTVMPGVAAPVLVLHARDDRLIPFAQGEALAKAARDGHFVAFDRFGHQLQFAPEAQDAIVAWLKERGF